MMYHDHAEMTYSGSYEEAVSFINSIPRFVEQADPSSVKRGLLNRVGKGSVPVNTDPAKNSFASTATFYGFLKEKGVIPETTCKVFHVAGTNGKGSVCAFLRSMHMEMGRRVGVFTSPHLTDIRERITINDEMISEEDFYDAYMTVASCLKEFRSHGIFASYRPVYFDWLFFIAAVYFGQMMPDAVIWETGLGGKYDATNVLTGRTVCVITEIGLDHMSILGDTKEKIAVQKAGIICPGVPVVTVKRDEGAFGVIEAEAKANNAPLVVIPNADQIEKKMTDKGIDFSYKSHYYNNATLATVGHAVYQVENATLAAAAMEEVYSIEELPFECIYNGIKNMHHPGRMEEIEPNVILDGAHNEDGIAALTDSMRVDGCKGARHLIFSAASDKKAEEELRMLAKSGLADRICIVPLQGERGRSEDDLKTLADAADSAGVRCELRDDLKEAFEEYRSALGEDDRLYVCGSLYLIGELKAYLRG